MAIIRSIQGKDWVMGMQWLTYDDPMSPADLRAESAELEMPWYSLRENENVFQCGFCEVVADISRPRKLASLAAMLADVRQYPWLGMFELADDVWWYVAIRDHYAIQLGGDVIGTLADVEAAADEHSGFGGWTRVVGTVDTLAELLREAETKRTKRTPVNSFAVSRIDPVPVAIAAGFVAVLGVIGLVGYHFHAQKILEAKRLAFMAQQAQREAKERVPDAQQMLTSTPAPSAWLQACGDGMGVLSYSRYAWIISNTECVGQVVRVTWARGTGATVEHTPPMTVSPDGNSGTQLIPMHLVNSAGVDNSADMETERRALRAWGQAHNVTVTIGATQAISVKQHAGWTTPVTIPMPVSPFLPGSGLDSIPGLRITSAGPNVQTRAANSSTGDSAAADDSAAGAWSLSGVLYARQ